MSKRSILSITRSLLYYRDTVRVVRYHILYSYILGYHLKNDPSIRFFKICLLPSLLLYSGLRDNAYVQYIIPLTAFLLVLVLNADWITIEGADIPLASETFPACCRHWTCRYPHQYDFCWRTTNKSSIHLDRYGRWLAADSSFISWSLMAITTTWAWFVGKIYALLRTRFASTRFRSGLY